ncbi:MAG: hypothetical protein ACREAA_13420 [Candidatus Polarisedimenticolia bacterium]
MKQQISDRDSFLKAMAPLREATFTGADLAYDEKAREMTFTLTREDPSTRRQSFLPGLRRNSWLRTVIHVRHIVSYRQSLASGQDEVYVLDRAEVGRGGQELAFYFRPGDRAVMDVENIEAWVEDAGRATAPPKAVIVNPIVAKDKAGRR